jgi:uncharacterized protein YfaS (alpha-2-macroglobulin family)
MMKSFLISLFLMTALGVSAQRQYTKEWKRIDSLIEKTGLIKTALKEVNAIYSGAKKEGNDVQLIKSLVYRMQLNDQLSDSGRYENIALLEKEISSAKEPAKSILHSIAGSSYWGYLQMNRWQFYQRSNTKGYDSKDISTWSLEQLYHRITSHFDESISNIKSLQQLKLETFEPILIKGNVRYLRPTLFDLLAFRALDYYRNDERYVTKPVYAFEINDSAAFADATVFVKRNFKTNDSLSLHHRALIVYQQLLAFHLNDAKHDALIDADLDRLKFIRNFSTLENKDELYKIALENLVRRYNNEAVTAEIIYELANWYYERGSRYDPAGDTSNRYSIVKAKQLCEKAMELNVKNEGSVNCKNLLKSILLQEIRTKAEEVNTTGEAFRLLVQYRNVKNVFVRIVKYDRTVRDKIGRNEWEDEYWKNVVALPVLKTYNYELPATNDYQSHRVEIKIDSLPVGEYGIVISSDKNFTLARNTMALQPVYVSDISYVNNKLSYYVLNRKTGAPLANAKVQVWENYYNQTKQREDIRKLQTYSTDARGYFELTRDVQRTLNTNFLLDISHGSDRLFIDKPFYNYVYDGGQPERDTVKNQTILFTDRAIYRPGQTIYFKGIVIHSNKKTRNNSVVSNWKSQVILYNANGVAVDSIHVTSNDFGSYSGRFTIPTGLLNGEFAISEYETRSSVSFRVEEYKRPKFNVTISPPKGTYRLNDAIKVEGTVVSYAGSKVNGASVNYRVMRRTIMPYWMGYSIRIWPPYRMEQMEIAHGSVTTDANGKFYVSFVAVPDNNVPRSTHPVFYYTVTTDVTDITGETRSGSINVNVGYEALKMELNMPLTEHVDSLKYLRVSTKNMNDSFERADVKISIYKLKVPQKIFRKRYWEQPDQFLMSREEYYKNFPYDQYDSELEKLNWPKENLVLQQTVSTSAGGAYKLNNKITDPGSYLIEALTRDKFGDSVTAREFVLLYNNNLISPEAGTVLDADKPLANVGEKVKYFLLTNIDGAQVIREVHRNIETTKDLVTTNKSAVGSTININESDRGGVAVKTVFVKNNRVYSDVFNIDVPFTNKQLKIDYTTYRDKTLPGSQEKWKVKISGITGEKVTAELLTSMYDASLDQFYPHGWTFPALWTGSSDNYKWEGDMNFSTRNSIDRNVYEPGEESFVKIYDQLRIDQNGQQVFARARTGKASGLEAHAFEAVVLDAAAPPKAENQQASEKDSFIERSNQVKQITSIQPRKNFNETAFFLPDLKTDSGGAIEFSFTSPEALTTWNWMLLAHTKDLAYTYDIKKVITQKQLMVQPNAPRFLREGDSINFSVKVINLSSTTIKGVASLELYDPSTGNKVTGLAINNKQNFSALSGQSIPLSFNIKIPAAYTQPLKWKVIATSENLSDGEEDIIPVVSNRMLVTESIVLPIRNTTSKKFTFDKLLKSSASKSLKNKSLTVEFTSNPAWYAIQALPYLTEQQDENAEQVFNRFYANALASKLVKSFPRLKSVIEQWQTTDTSAFLSNLQKNQDLKSILLEETPWVLDANIETQQKKNIALLFNVTRMSNDLKDALAKLISMQSENGSFVWFQGGPPDRYMTQYILSGIGRLKKLGAIAPSSSEVINAFMQRAIQYLDNETKNDYDKIKKNNKKISGTHIAHDPIQYLYMRSFFTNISVPANVKPAYNYFRNKVKQDWVKQNTYMRGMIAIVLQRTGDAATSEKIISALNESAIVNDELGMYWKDMTGGYYWYQAPIETQSLLIEAFNEIKKDDNAVAGMKTWLLKNKQTTNWKSTKATADACYALLLEGGSWIDDEASVSITLGEETVSPEKSEAGTGYFRKTFGSDAIKPSFGNIIVNLQSANTSRPAWGGVYWQYFEDLDKITNASTSLKIDKKLFVQKNTDRGPVIEALDKNNSLRVGDRVKVRIEIRTDRNMEYVHLKDMRSSALEPVNVLSEYKWQDGLGYYESTKDASTNFFFGFLPKGTHVFEYDLFVTHTGRFSNGVATIQCMYAPEFSSHSEGININVVQ